MADTNHRRKEDRYPGRVWVVFRSFFVVAGVAATVCFVLLVMTLSKVVNYTPPALPDRIVLSYKFRGNLVETVGKPSLSQPLLRPATTLREVTEALRDAAGDDRVKGFIAKLEDPRLNIAQVQELRDAVKAFRAGGPGGGKFAWIYSDSFGGMGSGMGAYYLASAFDRIWLQPVGAVVINGLAAEVPFGKDLLDKVGVGAEFGHKGIYKSMPESLTRMGMSEPHREMMESLVGDLAAQIRAGIAEGRGMEEAGVRALIDASPFTDAAALEKKLVDRLGYYDEMVEEAKKQAGLEDDKEIVNLTGYAFLSDDESLKNGMVGFSTKMLRHTAPPGVYKNKAKIALIYGVGDIVPRASRTHAGFGEGGMAADKIVAAFRSAEEDEDVAAVVFRVDSPGGSPEAAESIRRAVVSMQKKGRPVIVSMGGYAASGGYWVATHADKIVAEPGTITGSIGVFGGKLDLSRLWGRIGVAWDSVSEGANARMWSMNKPFSEGEKARFEAMLGGIYDAFIARVAEGRKMTKEQAEAVAEGRVWTGAQAKEKGLVDELGGLDRAIGLAKVAAGLDPARHVPVLQFPPRKSALELFVSMAIEGDEAAVWPLEISAGDVARAVAAEAGLSGDIARMPAFSVE